VKGFDLHTKRIVISRTDSIGDVMLTLPLCAWIKKNFPTATIVFLGKGYTRAVVEAYSSVNTFEDWGDYSHLTEAERRIKMAFLQADVIIHVFPNKEIAKLAKKVGIPVRIGTSHRSYHRFTCTHRPNFTRKRSELHEAQLNHELLRPVGLTEIPSLDELTASVANFKAPEASLATELNKTILAATKSIILHPKSQGSAKEWPMVNYLKLTDALIAKGYTVYYTGTDAEGSIFRDQLPVHERIIDTTGKLTLPELIAFIGKVDFLVACSTGPLHIAGFLGVGTIGFFSPKRPIHPGRWKALGPNVTILVNDEACTKCAKKQECDCIEQISVEAVMNEIA
jgi:heptosyltransferase-3